MTRVRQMTPAYIATRLAHDQRVKDAPPPSPRREPPRRERRLVFGCPCGAKWWQTAGARPSTCPMCRATLPVNHEGAPPDQIEELLVEIDAGGAETIINTRRT